VIATEPAPPRGWGALRHPVLWLKAHPFGADWILAVIAAAIPTAVWIIGANPEPGVDWREPDVGLAVLIALTSVPLAWRRRRPLRVLGITVVAALGMGALEYNTDYALFGDLVALYTVGAHCGRRASRRVLLAFAVVVGPMMLLGTGPEGTRSSLGEVAFAYLMYGTVWLVGDNLQTRRANVAALRERAERAERDREEEARRAVAEERGRIAREMHDVVAHSMSVMVVQASGARRVIGEDPDRAEHALELIEETGREALTEMRRLLGVLRDEDGTAAAGRDPQPSLDRLDDLVDECRAAGLPVALERRGEERPLPPGIDLAAFRIVQEALTNVRRHAGPASAGVTITYSGREVEVEVADDGRGLGADPPADGADTGHGLVGMRERAALYGGSVRAGPRPGGGFAVRALLPLDMS
jgi:signal transduction histidine kinase